MPCPVAALENVPWPVYVFEHVKFHVSPGSRTCRVPVEALSPLTYVIVEHWLSLTSDVRLPAVGSFNGTLPSFFSANEYVTVVETAGEAVFESVVDGLMIVIGSQALSLAAE
jgi:hypothetical protein